jgi:hypothetical protein
MENQSGRSGIALLVWGIILLLVALLVVGLLSGGWVIISKSLRAPVELGAGDARRRSPSNARR